MGIVCQVAAAVTVDWYTPWFGWGTTDKKLPGIPRETISEYQQELVAWGSQYNNVPITTAMSDAVISKAVNPFSQQTAITYTADIGTQTGLTGKFLDPTKPLWRYMRDIVFLETTQNAIADWKQNYYGQIGTGSVDESATYLRAEEIYKQYNAYLNGKDPDPNIIFPLLYSFVQFDYAGALTNDTVRDMYNRDSAGAIQALSVALLGNNNNLTISLDMNKLAGTATDLVVKEIRNSFKSSSGVTQMLERGLEAGTTSLVSGGSIVTLPGKVIGGLLDSFGTWSLKDTLNN